MRHSVLNFNKSFYGECKYDPNAALRYGFHKTDDCQHFEKAFLCVRKCLDLKFDIAYADKNCDCTCHKKSDKAKYTLALASMQTKYKSGAPTTTVPAWAQKSTREVSLQELESSADNLTKVNSDPKEATILVMKHSTEMATEVYSEPRAPTVQVSESSTVAKTEKSDSVSIDINAEDTIVTTAAAISETKETVTEAN
ncbi:hypothetical protein K1T71_002596 [Dendrolimus kikuchii]|uniref:Uncharacterized protein n=1 Tax=Dendrolimus kikuchii TaxID=765133 RepID=A0ACC1DD56_9NEOP|nr:hypothetical protein K1T71_002596 [Dendrolimus kikuchii]